MKISGYSDRGLVREKNEDSFGYAVKEDGIYYGLGYSLNGFGANFFVKSTECYKSKKELKAALGIK